VNKRINVLFSGHDFKFITPFIERCKGKALLDVRIDKHHGHVIDSEKAAKNYLEWADIVFCEWALGNAAWYSKNKKPGQLLIVRLHLQEVSERLKFLWEIDWSSVDKLILICHHTYDWMLKEFPELEKRAVIIYNPIDACGSLNRDKEVGAEFNLGFVGIVPQRKRFDLAIKIIEELKKYDSRFTLKVKGHRPEDYPWMLSRKKEMAWYRDVYEKIESLPYKNSIIFDPQGPDMAQWYSQVGFILSTSDFEGSHQTVAEGMAAGCIPIIRNWGGADRIYPEKYCIDTPKEAAQAILNWKSSADIYQSEVRFCREYAQERFDQNLVCDQLGSLFADYLEARGIKDDICGVKEAINVLILGYIPAGQHSGYRIRIEQEIIHLLEVGVEVQLGCMHPSVALDDLEKHREELNQLGCPVHMIEVKNFFELSLSAQKVSKALNVLEAIVDQQYDCHGVSPEEEIMSGANKRRIIDTEKWERLLLEKSDLNIFVSEAMQQHFVRKYGQTDVPHRVIPCCVQEKSFVADKQTGPTFAPDGSTVVGYLGTLVAWQCAPEMFRLFGDLHKADSSFFFSILTPENDHDKARSFFVDAGIPEDRYMIKQVPHEDVPQWMKQWDVGVLLRHDDPVNRAASPTKFGEYLAAGLPVLLTECIGDFSAMATDYGVALAVSSELLKSKKMPEPEIARIVGFVKQCKNERESVAGRCRKYAEEQLFWPEKVLDVVDGYHSIVK
jgi:glycosyltransferase involved in cell wall biosynthesis